MHTASVGDRALEHPVGQWRRAQRFTGVDVFLDHVGHGQPAGFLPQLKGALLHAKAPTHAKVDVTGVVGNRREVHGRIVEGVAQNGPQELALRTFAVAQQLEAFSGGLFQHAAIDFVSLFTAGYIRFGGQIETLNVAPYLFEESGLGFLTQVTHLQQGLEHLRSGKTLVERIRLDAESVLQGLDDMGHRVQPHHIGSAEGARTGTSQFFTGEVVHHIKAQAKICHLLHGRQHAGNADAVGDEVGGVLGPHHALAQIAGDKGFQVIQDLRLGGGRVDQLHQHHVARRVKEMNATEARLDFLRQRFAELGDRQTRGVGGNDGVRSQERRDFLVKIELPVHALGNRFNHQVAVFEQIQVLFVIGLLDQARILDHTQRRGLEFLQTLDGARDDAVFGSFFGGQIKQDDRHFDIDQMGGDLRAHHAGTQHSDFFDLKAGHGCS